MLDTDVALESVIGRDLVQSSVAAMHMKVREAVKRAKIEEGEWLLEKQPANGVEVENFSTTVPDCRVWRRQR